MEKTENPLIISMKRLFFWVSAHIPPERRYHRDEGKMIVTARDERNMALLGTSGATKAESMREMSMPWPGIPAEIFLTLGRFLYHFLKAFYLSDIKNDIYG
jgi:hypothetical protein